MLYSSKCDDKDSLEQTLLLREGWLIKMSSLHFKLRNVEFLLNCLKIRMLSKYINCFRKLFKFSLYLVRHPIHQRKFKMMTFFKLQDNAILVLTCRCRFFCYDFRIYSRTSVSGSNPDGSFTVAVSNSFLSPLKNIHGCRFEII